MRALLTVCLTLVVAGCATDTRTIVTSASTVAPPVAHTPEPGFLAQFAATRRYSLGRPRSIKVAPDGSGVLFLRSGPRSFVHDLYEFDATTGTERRILTAEQILAGAEEHLAVEEKARRERMRMTARGIASYQLSKDGTRILVPLSGRLFVVERPSGDVKELVSDKGYPLDPQLSPDGKKVASVRNRELFVMDIESGEERPLTSGASDTVTHGLSEFVAQEEMGRFHGFWWSPDSKTIAYQKTDTGMVESLHIMDAMHPEREAHAWAYPRAGTPNAKVELGLIPAQGGDTIWAYWDAEKYPYIATVKWSENAPLTMLVQNRRQTEQLLLSVDPDTGLTDKLLVERDEAWINLDQSMPHWLEDGSAFLWTTERNGTWQLELRGRSGILRTPLTPTDFRLKRFVAYDDLLRQVYVLGGSDPTQTHLFRLSLDDPSTSPARMTKQPGQHAATFGDDHSLYVHSVSTTDGRVEQIVRRINGREMGRLTSVAEEPPFMPNMELTTVGRKPTFPAVVIRPREFDRTREYPVIVAVYGGPHGQMVSASPRRYLLQQWMADHGFIVVSIDGRGTPSRGREWERAIKGNLIELPLSDQVAALQALGKKYREMDLTRVGVYGWSFGGYFSAHAVMQRPDVFHAGVAGAPVCDWRDYDTHYTERYMGLPEENPEGYDAAAVQTYADRLERPLLIIHGTADDNVYFVHALKMSNALFRAGKDHEFLPLSDFTHMVADPLVTERLCERIIGFFEDHLGVK